MSDLLAEADTDPTHIDAMLWVQSFRGGNGKG